jgi:hypothetical protein
MAANGTIQATIGRLKSEVDTLHTQLIALHDSWQVSSDQFSRISNQMAQHIRCR